ncbi:hypothetical protein ACJX0J_031186, partial [Zea mays]
FIKEDIKEHNFFTFITCIVTFIWLHLFHYFYRRPVFTISIMNTFKIYFARELYILMPSDSKFFMPVFALAII